VEARYDGVRLTGDWRDYFALSHALSGGLAAGIATRTFTGLHTMLGVERKTIWQARGEHPGHEKYLALSALGWLVRNAERLQSQEGPALPLTG
jgi:hypothetical protein